MGKVGGEQGRCKFLKAETVLTTCSGGEGSGGGGAPAWAGLTGGVNDTLVGWEWVADVSRHGHLQTPRECWPR